MPSNAMLFCDVHGVVSDGGLVEMEDVYGAQINLSGPCPYCGRPTSPLKGTYTETGGRLTAVLHLSPKQVFRLQQAARWAEQELASEDADEDHAVRVLETAIEKNAPEAKKWLDAFKGRTSMAAAAWAGVLVGIIGVIIAIVALNAQSGISEEQFQQMLEESVQAVLSEQARTGQVEPTPSAGDSTPGAVPPTATELPTPETR